MSEVRPALEASAARLRAILEAALDAVITMDAAGRIVDWNPRAEAIFGWSRQEAVGRTVAETVIPPRFREAHRRGLERFLVSGESSLINGRIEIEALGRDGHEFPVEISITSLTPGGVRIFSAFIRDITDRRRAQAALRESEERFRKLFEETPVGMAFVDLNFRFIRVNDALSRMLGYSPDELVGRHFSDITHPDDIENSAQAGHQLLKGEVPSLQVQKRYLTRYNSIVWAHVTSTLARDEKGVPYIHSIVENITERHAAEDQLRHQLAFTRTITTTAGAGIYVVDDQGRMTYMNPAAEQMFGWSEADLLGKSIHDIIHFKQADGTRLKAEDCRLLEVIRTGQTYHSEEEVFVRRDGTIFPVAATASPIVTDGKVTGEVLSMLDITARKQAEAALRQQADLYEPLLKAQSELGQVILISEDDHILYANEALVEITGHGHEELDRLQAVADLIIPEERAAFLKRLHAEHAGETFETSLVRKDGRQVDLEVAFERYQTGDRRRLVVLARDITDRKQVQKALEHQALHDLLTDLPNRTLLEDRLAQAILNAQRQLASLGLLVMDLDRFKEVNDTFGHHAGDALLRQVGYRLQEKLRATDTVARFGGDEFAIVLPGADGAGATHVAQQLLKTLERPFLLEQQVVEVSASIGIAVFPDHGDDAATLLRKADIAMYAAKNAVSYAVYNAEQDRQGPNRLALVAELRRAIEEEELLLCYQPLVSIRTGRPRAMEALVRWRHPSRGLVLPGDFIPVAEQTGLMTPLTQWVLRTALRQTREWRDRRCAVSVCVNLAVRSLLDPYLPDLVAAVLTASEAKSGWLTLEITESGLMVDPELALKILSRLRQMGVRLALDDFGTGYSSLAYLQRLPLAEVKIDKSFVSRMSADAGSAAIVRATIELGHTLGFKVVAEGVEDVKTWDLLAQFGCDTAQGYYLSRPMIAAEANAWLARASGSTSLHSA